MSETRARLIERLEDVDRRVQSIANNTNLTPSAQMNALALLVSLHGDIYARAAAELRRAGSREGALPEELKPDSKGYWQ